MANRSLKNKVPVIHPSGKVDYDELIQLWEISTRHTYRFLSEVDIQFYKLLLRYKGLPAMRLFAIRNEAEQLIAFMGLGKDSIDMLFVHPNEQGKGHGKHLLDFAVQKERISNLKVDKQNTKALQFYLNRGFNVIGENATDAIGKPYSTLYMSITPPLTERLSTRSQKENIQKLLYELKYSKQLQKELYQLIYSKDNIISYQALWTCSLLNHSENKWLYQYQDELINEVFTCSHPGKRRLLLQILQKQSFPTPPRVDFLNFCLDRMFFQQELPSIQSLCIKLAYELCRQIPELLQELRLILESENSVFLSPATQTSKKHVLIKIRKKR